MSRTDAHRPVWVRALDPLEATRDRHDHLRGPCDLVTTYDQEKQRRSAPRRQRWAQRCYRDLDYNLCGGLCSCHMCHPKISHGRARVLWRSQRQELIKLTCREDFDVTPFNERGWW